MTAEESDDAVTKAIERRRRAIEAEWNELGAVVLIGAGDPIPIPGRADRVYPFLAHSEYFYLTDHQRPGAVLAYDPQEGWSEFVRVFSADERLWSGELGDDVGTPASELAPWLEKRRGRRVAQLGAPISSVSSDAAVTGELRTRMDRVRRRKDALELARMRRAADATRAGFTAVVPFIAPGITERALQIEIEAEFFRHGADTVAYDSIIASGPNAAVLHHLPTQRPLRAGELVLIDAGAECRGYDCDVTRTYPVSGDFSAEQADVYALVLQAQRAAIGRCRAGVEYRDIHLAAALDVAQGLVDAGFLRGNAADLVEQGASALFFPHGIGHMVGLGVRDAGGYLPGRSRSEAPALRFLRIDLPLEPGHVVTIEPGIYFPSHVLDDPEIRRQYRDTVAWNRVDKLRGFGGIRIEDNVLILDGGNEVLTRAIPKE
ncbi:MAG TPA: aminopeptidase P family protein [Rhodothermia bacterium]|nr:aminopeptidase P family protein [Rhodothermia bacterium]